MTVPAGAMTLFEQVLALPDAERAAWLAAACAGRPDVHAEVLRMLAHDARLEADAGVTATTPLTPPPLPSHLGNYRILERIGEGACGTVLRAEQDQPRREVALKLLQSGSVSTASMRRFLIEAEALARLHHPGVVRIWEAGVADLGGAPIPFLATELVRGVPLHEWRRQGPDRRAAIAVVLQILDTIEYVHRQGIIHRDLKPANVMLRDGPAPRRVCILDFGVARLLQPSPDGEHTLPGAIVGTLAYMSPEQASGRADVDTRTDVYAVGAIAYELLAGVPPVTLTSGDLLQSIAQVRSHEPLPLGHFDARLRGDLEAVVGKALSKDPDDRYGSARAFADDLQRVLAHEPVLARRPTPWHRFALFARRRRGVVAALGLLVVILATAIPVVVVSYADVRAARAQTFNVLAMVSRRVFELESSLGTVPLRRELLSSMQGELATLAELTPADPSCIDLRARLCVALGNLELQEDRRDAARPLRDEALRLRQHLLTLRPDDPAVLAEVAADLVRRGDLAKNGADPRPAKADWLAGQALLEAVVVACPDEPRALDDLAHGCNRLAHVAIEEGDLDEAQRLLDRQRELVDRLDELAAERLANAINRRSLCIMQAHLAAARGDRQQWSAALRAAMASSDRVLARQPQNIEALIGYLTSAIALVQPSACADDPDRAAVLDACATRLARAGHAMDDVRVRDAAAYFATLRSR